MPSFGPEWIIVLIVALLVLGPKRLPEVGSALGKTIREFRQGLNEAKDAAGLEAPAPPAQPAAAATQPAAAAAQPAASPPSAQAAETPAPGQPATSASGASLAAAAGTELQAAALPAPAVASGSGTDVGHQPGPAA